VLSGPPNVWVTRGAAVDRQPVYSPDAQWIVFTSNRSGNLDLWAASTKTRTVRRLTDHPASDWDPAFVGSPPSLLWSSNRAGHFEIWTAQADGSGAGQLSHDGADAENPTATHDGQWIVYLSASPDHAGLWKQRATGGPATKLASGTFGWPEVSPDGQYILVTVLLANRPELQVVRLTDGAVLPFKVGVPHGGTGRSRWTPDGRRIVFVDNDARGRSGLYIVDFSPAVTAPAPRPFLFPEIEGQVESFGLSPDGSRVTVAAVEDLWTLQTIDGLPGITLPERK
jgi:TolB protein